jgi:hypothetical protein
VHQSPTDSYNALIKAGRPDLTAEAVVAADADAPWASEFTDKDRAAARPRVGVMLAAHDPWHRLVRKFGRLVRKVTSHAIAGIQAAFSGIRAAVKWLGKSEIWPWWVALVALAMDYVVVRRFITAEPPPPSEPGQPGLGRARPRPRVHQWPPGTRLHANEAAVTALPNRRGGTDQPPQTPLRAGRARLKGDEGQQIWTEWAILAYNTDTLARPDPVKHSEAAPRPERNPIHHERPRTPSRGRFVSQGSIRGK